jgi:hypothetical protein
MLEAVTKDLVFTISLKRSTQNLQLSTSWAGRLHHLFESDLQRAAASHDNLRRYVGRMTARFYPELSEVAGCQAAA